MPIAKPIPLARDAFSPYGAVIEVAGLTGSPANDGRALRFDQPGAFAKRATARDPALAIYAIDPSDLPLKIDYMERHPASCQLFLPMNAGRYLVIAAKDTADGGPCVATLQAFIATSQQGVCYGPGVWHYPLVSLDRAANFAMIMWQGSEVSGDCEVRPLGEPVEVRE